MKEKKKVLLVLGILIALISVVGISYAVWQLTLTQTGTNVVTSGCFKVEFTDQNPITLTNAYPITNEEGKTLTPYEFTITNTCESEASYQVNLEILNDSTFTETSYIRGMLNEKGSTSGSRILTRNKEAEKTLENASLAYKLNQGVLAANESKTFEFRLWMDYDTPAIESVMEKTLNSKITVITSLKLPVDTTNMMVAMDVDQIDESTTYNNTYTQGEKYQNTLRRVIFESEKNPIANALEVKDFSVNQDQSVLGYYVENEEQSEVTLHIQADGKIKVNTNGSYYFSYGEYIFEGIENLDTSEVTNMSYMFWGNRITNLDVSNFDTSNVTDMSYMFYYTKYLTSLDLSYFDTSNVTNMSAMFSESDLTSLDLGGWDTSNVTDMSNMFYYMSSLTNLDLSSFDTSNVTNMNGMFFSMSSLTTLDISHFDTSNVTDMGAMFSYMEQLTSLDLRNFDTSNVKDMCGMFSGMKAITSLDVSNFDTRNVTYMFGMFSRMESLISLDLSTFDTRNVTDMNNMFQGMSSLTNLDVRSFDTRNVTDMSGMFRDMTHLTSLDLISFDTSSVTNMTDMFYNASNLTNVTYGEYFIHKEGATISYMYKNCPANKPTYSSWSSVTW